MPDPATFNSGIDIELDGESLSFRFGEGVFGPTPEMRSLDAIRPSLLDPGASGPDPVYGIAMDVGREAHRSELQRRWLLFGLVAYSAGQLGREPVRSQGHVHAIAPHSGWSPPELFEIWHGRSIIYMQEHADADPGRCFAIEAGTGEHVIVPPGWMHFVANADPTLPMAFAALCDRQYGFVYDAVRARGGPAWFPVFEQGQFHWQPNPAYGPSTLRAGSPRSHEEFNLRSGVPLYEQFAADPEALQWVSDPVRMSGFWSDFNPLGVESAIHSS
jgi:glucose-6-phosphate isomerase